MSIVASVEKETVRFGPFQDLIAVGVKVGNTIYLSGQVSIDPEGQVVGEGDFVAQVRQCYANVEDVLTKYGATLDNVVDEMWL